MSFLLYNTMGHIGIIFSIVITSASAATLPRGESLHLSNEAEHSRLLVQESHIMKEKNLIPDGVLLPNCNICPLCCEREFGLKFMDKPGFPSIYGPLGGNDYLL